MNVPPHMGVRDEYAPEAGRQVLTLWSGMFASEYEGQAVELPEGGGYMVTLTYGYPVREIRVACKSPRTDRNWMRVDEAINAQVNAAVLAAGAR